MSVAAQKYTAVEFMELPEVQAGAWMELVNGEVIKSPRPNMLHGYAAMKLATMLDTHIEQHQLGVIYPELNTIFDVDEVRIPDLLFFARDRMPPKEQKYLDSIPDMCIEFLSPSNARTDRVDKFQLYQDNGVRFYWIVDPEEHTIEGYALDAGRYVSTGRARDSQSITLPPFPDLQIPLAKLWHP